MIKVIAAVIAVLAAQSAFAEQRENKAFNTVGGRSSAAAPEAPRIITVAKPGGGMSANAPAPAAPAQAAQAVAGGGHPVMGGGRQALSRNASGRGVQRRGKAFGAARQVDAGTGGGAGGTTAAPKYETADDERPPNYDKPGALIRTTGHRLPQYEKAEDPRVNTVDAGEIVLNKNKAFNVGQAPSVQYGPRDTPPPPNPTSGGMGTSVSANGPTNASSNSGGGKGGGLVIGGTPGDTGNGGGGHDNNGNGNNDKGKPGDDWDPSGGDKAKDKAFYDAF